MNIYNIISLVRGKIGLAAIASALIFSSCEKYVNIDKAPNQLLTSDAYLADGTATSAVLAMYSYYYTTYSLQYFTFVGELESGEMQYQYSSTTLPQFQQSAVATTNSDVLNYLWLYPYSIIREANLAIEGLQASTTLTASVKTQLLGEARFFRAYTYFNLVNYFGGVPLVLSSDALTTATQLRATSDQVYAQVIADLKLAVDSLPATYTGTLHTRVNKYAAAALLARVYLYNKDYVNAEAMATTVINASDVTYSLPTLANAFVNTSSEVILQVGTTYGYSLYGSNYRTTATSGIPNYCLTKNAMAAFEQGDNRLSSWVDSITSNNTTYYRINKYKLSTATAGNEYNVILRLGELYLIRAEARAQQNNLDGAKTDLNIIRTRAGLSGVTATTTASVLSAIAKERQTELFGETGHRWFDLKRTDSANAVLSVLKPTTWTATAVLLPIPYSEILKNTALTQNPGY